ncbi:3-deoxy-manno-octulosonate cytidylyltransferase (CMP-KDO synthetase) [Ectothiorhodosinus mongolicus]|uniref:3-deoxy-manno-octulosonate cytidylyltransferase (CMP-KDO synthetase) n=1 Tax=Ectothiorhodosinus mongolicus TaxID=233100 RepID=A0A1R3VPQ3_9GAMM|nr:3-deoxy-manno-octulosonate cytidylyltransferase [Ectothiorhodosinus mongolicus]ULX56394.1 3-deoxy-manno-octulosonate cytidylyltransferase [Ectothiorhodosinus mongolicus]SIT65915.1 3-deoxy-manno-octulosonate cytidylyltransferase (CMP-KDO synthetase) [Ectothiorhodosinus mongolicus]
MHTAIIVPARLGSTRFPQKLLHPVRGKPVLLWTAEQIRREAPEFDLWFAVDSERLKNLLEAEGYRAVITDPELPSGTDRIAAANEQIGAARIINVQADEPMVTGEQIRLLDKILTPGVDMATLGFPLTTDRDYHNPNHVKMVCAQDGAALYFSRSPIPYVRETVGRYDADLTGPEGVLIHVGLFAYTQEFLATFAKLPMSHLERLEKLEMLRALEHGYRIATAVTHDTLIEIDTPENIIQFEEAVTEHFNPEY